MGVHPDSFFIFIFIFFSLLSQLATEISDLQRSIRFGGSEEKLIRQRPFKIRLELLVKIREIWPVRRASRCGP